jgi:hypothetical protein
MEGAKPYFNKDQWGPQMKAAQVVAKVDRQHQLHLQQGHEPYDPKCEECIGGNGRDRPHFRQKSPSLNTIYADVAGPFVKSQAYNKEVNRFLVVMACRCELQDGLEPTDADLGVPDVPEGQEDHDVNFEEELLQELQESLEADEEHTGCIGDENGDHVQCGLRCVRPHGHDEADGSNGLDVFHACELHQGGVEPEAEGDGTKTPEPKEQKDRETAMQNPAKKDVAEEKEDNIASLCNSSHFEISKVCGNGNSTGGVEVEGKWLQGTTFSCRSSTGVHIINFEGVAFGQQHPVHLHYTR